LNKHFAFLYIVFSNFSQRLKLPGKTCNHVDDFSLKKQPETPITPSRRWFPHLISVMDTGFDQWLLDSNLADEFFYDVPASEWDAFTIDDSSQIPPTSPDSNTPIPIPNGYPVITEADYLLEPTPLSARRPRRQSTKRAGKAKLDACARFPEDAAAEMTEWILANMDNPFLT
jgi:hypothetical protein